MKTNQLKSGAILSYTIIFLSNMINILFTPFMLKSLGRSEYGLFTLIGSFVGYMAVLDFGLGNTIIRYVAKYRAEKNKKSEENFLAMCLIIYFFISIIVLIIGMMLYRNIQFIFKNSLTDLEISRARTLFMIIIINLAVSLPLNAFTAIMSGYEKFVFPRTLNIIKIVLRTALLYILLNIGYKAVAIALLDTVLYVSLMLVNVIYVFTKLKVSIKLYSFDRGLMMEIFSYSFFIFLNMIVDQIYWRLGQFVLGTIANTAAVAIYAVGIQFANYYMQFSMSISGVFLPRATQMVVKRNRGKN